MNYVRLMEIPLTLYYLDLKPSKNPRILDISSPKLLSLYLMLNGFKNIVITDLEDYFVKDFQILSEEFKVNPLIDVFNAIEIPYKNNSFDSIFSISVIEHIYKQDTQVIKEIERILKPRGTFVFTAPAFPFYLEEWILEKKDSMYWRSVQNKEKGTFYHCRYDKKTLLERFGGCGLEIELILFIAEKPIKYPKINSNGKLFHNFHFIQKVFKKTSIFGALIPWLNYSISKFFSSRFHYLTEDEKDPNIRQVIVKMQKI